YSPANIINVDVSAEDEWGVYVVLLDGRAGEANERCVRQRIAHVLGEAVGYFAGLFVDPRSKSVLAAVRFVSDHHYVPALRHWRNGDFIVFGKKLLNRGEDHTPGG